LSPKSYFFNSISHCIFILMENSKQENLINQLFNHKSNIFNWISDYIYILRIFKTKKSNQSTFELQIPHFQFNFWYDLHLFRKLNKRKFNQFTFESQLAPFQFNFSFYFQFKRKFKTRKSNQSTFEWENVL
jgi:hypothetical protein